MKNLALVVLAAVAGCASGPQPLPSPPTAGSVESIRYEKWPGFGSGVSEYVLIVRSDGTGTFEGPVIQRERLSRETSRRNFTVTAEQFAVFKEMLERYRPAGDLRIENDPRKCATDAAAVDVTWTAKGPQSHLYAYFGCDMERNATMFEALRRAPEALGVDKLIGGR